MVKAFPACKQEDGHLVSPYLLKMKDYLDILERLGEVRSRRTIKKPQGAKGKDKGNNKLAYAPKPKISPPPKRDNPTKDLICHHCKEGLRRMRKLKHGVLNLYVGNRMRAAVEAIRSFDLILPNGLVIVLDNYHYAPSITKGDVSLSHLVDNGYMHTFMNYGISVMKDDVFYFNAIPRDGIYEIDKKNLYPNVNSIYNVSNKRAKRVLDYIYFWHCCLGHINKKHIEKLQRDRILQPTDDESFDKCKSCISRKMTRKPFTHQVERAKELLGLIHTDVYSPFRTVSREGASYFITFIDNFSHYGYVYLMKHKHESFWGYALESVARILKMVPTKKVDKTPYEIWNGKAPNMSYFKNSFTLQETSRSHTLHEASASDIGLELLQELDIQPLNDTSKQHNEVEPNEVEPYSMNVPIRRYERIYQAHDIYGFYVDVEEHELGDQPPNYKVALSYPEFDKGLDAMNAEIQSIEDNQVWCLVDLPHNGRTVRSKWLFKKNTDKDGNVHTFKARLVAKGYTQTYGVDYEEPSLLLQTLEL
ncbi:retrotransposon protein, putative, ty1-copia subclass [Tanacetum coccineum]